jgi:putative phosphoesterase
MAKQIVGVISDTHGLLRKEVIDAFSNCHIILHAGDIGKFEIIEALESLAPVVAVHGNCDRGDLTQEFSETDVAEVGDVSIYIIHNIDELDIVPEVSGFDVVVFGHSHKPAVFRKKNVLYINPGSAGPRRFNLPVGIAKLYIEGKNVEAELIDL